jgi:hypothetical protein
MMNFYAKNNYDILIQNKKNPSLYRLGRHEKTMLIQKDNILKSYEL